MCPCFCEVCLQVSSYLFVFFSQRHFFPFSFLFFPSPQFFSFVFFINAVFSVTGIKALRQKSDKCYFSFVYREKIDIFKQKKIGMYESHTQLFLKQHASKGTPVLVLAGILLIALVPAVAAGTAKSGVGVAHLGILHADRIMRGIVPVVMAGILGIYGLIVSVIINNNIKTEPNQYSAFSGYLHFGAGLAAGLSSLAAGLSIGIAGDASVRAYGKQEKIFVAMILMLIFAEALGLYGLIIALLMNNTANKVNYGPCQ
uniref:V-type proton ATPase proteolipid subunit n=1 Tax=Trypanosoma vivax (strain Y486) TaxID=1055687 RepID=G0U512_TRYVY|nr:putative Vacuolar ATP synthase, fragment [Trypanosoma vivax Y486]